MVRDEIQGGNMKKSDEYGVLFMHYLAKATSPRKLPQIRLEITFGLTDKLEQIKKKECGARSKAQKGGTGSWHEEWVDELNLSAEEVGQFATMLQNPLVVRVLCEIATVGFERGSNSVLNAMSH